MGANLINRQINFESTVSDSKAKIGLKMTFLKIQPAVNRLNTYCANKTTDVLTLGVVFDCQGGYRSTVNFQTVEQHKPTGHKMLRQLWLDLLDTWQGSIVNMLHVTCKKEVVHFVLAVFVSKITSQVPLLANTSLFTYESGSK